MSDHVNQRGIAGIVNRDVLERTRASQPHEELEECKEAPLTFPSLKNI